MRLFYLGIMAVTFLSANNTIEDLKEKHYEGNTTASFELANLYEMDGNLSASRELLLQLTFLGDSNASKKLGLSYLYPKAGNRECKKGISFLFLGSREEPLCLLELSKLFKRGICANKDKEKQKKYFNLYKKRIGETK